jgi:CelD/BcsL family acetyltransferase involved in cellulose biosynthesis
MIGAVAPSSKTPSAGPVAGITGLSVEIRDMRSDPERAEADAAAIDALVQRRPDVGAFLATAWLSGFHADPPRGVELRVAELREGRTLRGFAPLAVRRTTAALRITLLGGGVGSDRVDLLAARGYEALFADRLLDSLTEFAGSKGFVLELRDVPGDSPIWGAVRRARSEHRLALTLVPRELHAHPYLDLHELRAGSAADPGLAAREATLAKHRRWLERRGRLKIDVLADPAEVRSAFDWLVECLSARWGGTASALSSPRAQRFHRHVMPRLLAQGRLRLIRFLSDMRPIAVFYGIANAGWFGYYLAGYDRKWAGRIHLGQIVLATAIDRALSEGAAEFDFLKGPERVKYLWPVRERLGVDADVYSSEAGAQLVRAARAAREGTAAVARSARALFPDHPFR